MWLSHKQETCNSANHIRHVESSAIQDDATLVPINRRQFKAPNGAQKWRASLRACYRYYSYRLGTILQRHFRKVLLGGVLMLSLCCLGLLSIQLETKVEKLWMSGDFRKQQALSALQTKGETSDIGYTEALIHSKQRKDNLNEKNDAGVLNPSSMLTHLNALRRIIRNVQVVGPDQVQYNYEKLCVRPVLPRMSQNEFTHILDSLMPCQLVTPLDCFWEGAKLRGPNHALQFGESRKRPVSWSNFNPIARVRRFQRKYRGKDFSPIIKFLQKSGVSSGYMRKPCLQPNNTECPSHMAHRQRGEAPNILVALQDGCRSFASNLMHWRRELLIGGLTTSPDELDTNGQPKLLAASAMMSTLFLKSARHLHDDIRQNIPHIVWTVEQTEDLIKKWLRLMRQEVARLDEDMRINSGERFLTVNELALDDESLLNSIPSYIVPLCSSCLVAIYLMFCFVSWRNFFCSNSPQILNSSRQVFLALVGTLLMSLAVTAALGIAALLQLTFNMLTMQLLPGLMLGLASSDWLNLVAAFQRVQGYHKDVVGLVLQDQALPILHGNCALLAGFLMGSLSSFPALRIFCFQASLVIAFQCFICLTLLPALLAMDLVYRKNLCALFCYRSSMDEETSNEFKSESCLDGDNLSASLNTKAILGSQGAETVLVKSMLSINRSLSSYDSSAFLLRGDSRKTSLQSSVCTGLAFVVVLITVVSLGLALYGASTLKLGFEWNLVIPRESSVAMAMSEQSRNFGLQTVHSLIGEAESSFNFAKQQDLLRQFHRELTWLPNFLPVASSRNIFWLDEFRDWLREKQNAFDEDVLRGAIRTNLTWTREATVSGLLGMRLLLLTGQTLDRSVDERRLISGRLVDNSGQIHHAAFNHYLRVWYTMDQLNFLQLQTVLHPSPAPLTIDLYSTNELSIPACDPLKFTLTSLTFYGVNNSDSGMRLINDLQRISTEFMTKGLPNSASGFLFKYLGQLSYTDHIFHRLTTMIAFGLAIPLLLTLVMMVGNVKVVLLSCLTVLIVAIQFAGLQGAFGFRYNYMSLLSLLLSCVLASRLTNQFITMYIGLLQSHHSSSLACLQITLRSIALQLLHGAMLSLLGVIFLFNCVYDFIGLYFLKLFAAGVLFALLDVIVVLPALIHLCGLKCVLTDVNKENEDCEKPPLENELSLSQISLEQTQEDDKHFSKEYHQDPLDEISIMKVNDLLRKSKSTSNIVSLTSARLSTILEEINERSTQLSAFKENLRDMRTLSVNKLTT